MLHLLLLYRRKAPASLAWAPGDGRRHPDQQGLVGHLAIPRYFAVAMTFAVLIRSIPSVQESSSNGRSCSFWNEVHTGVVGCRCASAADSAWIKATHWDAPFQ